MRFLDIIIPQYGETASVVETALNSIARQKNVDFNEIGVYLINDHSKNQIKSTTLKKFPQLNITYLVNEKNMGPGLTRQRGIDLSEAEYVTFLDADDEFYGDEALSFAINFLKNEKPNVVYSNIYREYIPYDKIELEFLTPQNMISLHGIFLKRNWLIEKEIRFHSDLFYYEDTYFIQLIQANRDVNILNVITYLWKQNEKSMTKPKKYAINVDHIDDLLHCAPLVKEYIEKHNLIMNNFFLKQILTSFIWLESTYFDYPELNDKKEKYELELYKIIKDNLNYFDDKNMVLEEYNSILTGLVNHYPYFESNMDIYEFIQIMDNK